MAYPILAPNSTWYKSTQKRSTITEINIVDNYSGTADEIWNADKDNSGSIKCYRTGTILTIAGNGSGKIAMNPDSSYLFSSSTSSNRFTALAAINGAELLDATAATTFERMFQSCEKLTYVNVSNWNTGNVTNMFTVFSQCYVLDGIDVSNWNTANVEMMRGMFQGCIGLTALDLSAWNVDKVTDMYGMFLSVSSIGEMALTTIGDTSGWKPKIVGEGAISMFQMCANLTNVDLSGFDMSNATSLKMMFMYCYKLKTVGDLSKWNTSKVTDMSSMFSGYNYGNPAAGIESLNINNWDTSACTDMSAMFYGCKNLKNLDISNWDVSKVETFDHFIAHSNIKLAGDGVARWVTSSAKTMDAMLYSCQNEVLDVSNFDTSNVLTFNQMFESCTKLKKIIGLENFVTSTSQDFSEMFWNCTSLEELNLSAFDTRNATTGADRYGRDGEKTTTMIRFFPEEIGKLNKVILGKNFSFNGDGTTTTNIAVLPTPSSGIWYNASGDGFKPEDVPDKIYTTYFASPDMLHEKVKMRVGTMTRFADALRDVTDDSHEYLPTEMISKLYEIPSGDIVLSQNDDGSVLISGAKLVSQDDGSVLIMRNS